MSKNSVPDLELKEEKLRLGMVKCRIRNVKERKIWSENFKRDRTQLERSKGNEKS